MDREGEGEREGRLYVGGFYEGGAMNIVDKLTPNSKTVVNTEEEKKHFECCSSCY